MKSKKKIYLPVGLAVVLLFVLLWRVFDPRETAIPEQSVSSFIEKSEANRQASSDTDTVTASFSEAEAVRPVIEEKKVRSVVLETKTVENRESKDTVLPDLTLPPLHLAATVSPQMEDTLPVELQAHPVAARKTKEDVINAWKADTLPVKKGIDLLRIKKVGRFDRGIVNYRFMPKGQTMFGLDASFWNFDSRESKLLFAYLDNFTFNAKTVSVNPFIGYFFKDNQAIGMKWGYRQTSGKLENVSVKIDEDVNFSLKDLGLKEEIYSCTFFHRSYIGLDAGKRFGLFNETSLNIGYGKSVFTRGADEALKETTTKILEARLGISPGLAVFIMENVSVECSIGVMGLKYRQEKQTNNLGENGQHLNGGANFKINLFDLNLGLIITL